MQVLHEMYRLKWMLLCIYSYHLVLIAVYQGMICRWFSLTRLDGSFRELYEFGRAGGLKGLLKMYPIPSLEAWKIIVGFGIFEAVLQLYMPGKEYLGPKSPKGNTPVYKANGLQCYAASLLAFVVGWRYDLF